MSPFLQVSFRITSSNSADNFRSVAPQKKGGNLRILVDGMLLQAIVIKSKVYEKVK